jgi:hypothetical protein
MKIMDELLVKDKTNLNILELGAGTGLPGLFAYTKG